MLEHGGRRTLPEAAAFWILAALFLMLVTSVLVQYAPAPTHLIWWALLAAAAAGIPAVLALAEPGARHRGALASLRPRIAVPRQARGTFAGAVPCLVATWALGGLYLSLGPSLAAEATGSANLVWGGLVTAIFAVGYLAFSVPALIAGVTATRFGLHATALVYSASVAVLVVAATGVLLVRRRAVSGS